MSSVMLGFVIFGGALACLTFAIGLDVFDVVFENRRLERDFIKASESYDGGTTVELYGPPADQMTLNEFLDFWVLMTEDQKDHYVKQSWSYVV